MNLRVVNGPRLIFRGAFVLFFALATAYSLTACSSRNLHPKFKNDAEILQRQWTYSIEPLSSQLTVPGMEYTAPTIHDNTIVFGTERYGLVSLYPKIQRERWKIQIPNGIVSQIELVDNSAFFTGGDGNVYSVALDTGKTQWTYALRNPVASKPTINGPDLYLVTSDDAVLALESQTGKWQWHYRRRNVSGPTIHGASRPLIVGDTLWVGFADGALVCLTRKEGKVLWEKQLNSNKRFPNVNAELLLKDDIVYVPAYDNALYALNAKSGNPVWVNENMGGSKKVSIENGVLYAPTSTGEVYALDAKTGKQIWKFELDQGISSDVVVLEKHVVVASSSEYLYAINKATGVMEYRFQIGYGSGFSGGLAFDATRNWIYALSRGGNLLSFSYHPNAKKL